MERDRGVQGDLIGPMDACGPVGVRGAVKRGRGGAALEDWGRERVSVVLASYRGH